MIIAINGPGQTTDSTAKVFSAGGYVKELPYLQFVGNEKSSFDNILNFRLNLSLQLTGSARFVLELRNRLMAGESGWGSDAMVQALKDQGGWLNPGVASRIGGNAVVHAMADRFFAEYTRGKWQIRAGRQRINWGINMVSNPNDLFNTYSFFDFDYPERPGSDAIRVQYFGSELSHAEVAFAPADHIREAVGAFLYGFNYRKYDVQLIGGYYRNRIALGGGWAGRLGEAGFKGEAMLFHDSGAYGKSDLIVSVSLDYLFRNGLFLVAEGLYNGGYDEPAEGGINFSKSLSADNIMFSTYAATVSASFPVSPVLNSSMACMYLFDIRSFFISPSLSYSILQNLDLALISQIYGGHPESGDRFNALALIGSIQWSF